MENMTVRIPSRYRLLSNFEWQNIPAFAVVTGVNGSGKSQLLEVIASSLNAFAGTEGYGRPPASVPAAASVTGPHFGVGEVFHAYGEWLQLGGDAADEGQVKEAIRTLHSEMASHPMFIDDAGGPFYHPVASALAELTGTTPEAIHGLALKDFSRLLTPGLLWSYAAIGLGLAGNRNLAFLFLAYVLLARDARARDVTEEEIHRLYGEPPWVLLNEILETSGLRFRVAEPKEIRPTSLAYDNRLELHLRTVDSDLEVPFQGLSSGEKVIMSTVLWRYGMQLTGRHYKLLLLDEPDAHLHPSLTRNFLDVIRKVFVEERQVRVIMSTHSPSTVALVPGETLFEMSRGQIQRAPSKAHAISLLTEGLVTVQEATQTVMLEGLGDPDFYQRVWDLLTMRLPSWSGPLEPYPNLAFVYGQGREVVNGIVPQMQSSGLNNFHGIIDLDTSNTPSDGVHVLGRNGMENYLFDPLNVACALHSWDEPSTVSGVHLPRGQGASIRDLPKEDLQSIADVILRQVEGSTRTSLGDGDKTTEDVKYANGITLRYPQWFLYGDDHEIENGFSRVFGYKQLSRPSLLRSYATLNMAPQDLFDLLQEIQASGRP